MPLDPDLITARRVEARRRRRVRRRRLLVGVCALAGLIVVVVVLAGGPGRRSPGAAVAARHGRTPRPGGTGSRVHELASHQAQRAALNTFVRLGLPLYCGGLHGRYVALTFDDGPGVYTHLALRYLRGAHAHATFFLVGRNLPIWRTLPREELKVGTLGDHTYTHPYLPGLPAAAVRSELAKTQDDIAALTGLRTPLFRPPYGAFTPAVVHQAEALGMLVVLWNVDSADSLGANKYRIAANVVRRLRPGSIVLMHENRGQTIAALWRSILPALRRKHLHAVTIPELLALDPPSMRQLRAGPNGCPFSSGAFRPSG